jgi:hypothetical protein
MWWIRGYEEDWTRKTAFVWKGAFLIGPLLLGDILLDSTHYRSGKIGLAVSPQKRAGYLGPSWREGSRRACLSKYNSRFFSVDEFVHIEYNNHCIKPSFHEKAPKVQM